MGERSNIVSSTLIEDVPHRTNNNQFNRFNLPLENGQHATSSPLYGGHDDPARDTASNYPDEASSSQSREKPTNPFAINNDSSVVNFSAHLQRAKSLFTNRSYVSPRLKNYRMRNPRSSLYRSTSSLCDNNSVSSNASSAAMSSPFYNGQTTFGGASATSRRTCTTLNQDLLLHHRPKVPTNLVTSRSTSSLNSIGGSGSQSMSTTAKRILDVMSKYNTPLTEVRRISNALPSIAETSALNKRGKSILELESSVNEIDKTKRLLMKPNTPYNRPFGRNPIETALTTELHVPSMPELLQLKKFATNTMRIRDIASSNSDSVLNKPAPPPTGHTNQFKLSKTALNRADGDLDTSNNNKSVNNKNNNATSIVASAVAANEANIQDKYKIRSNINKRKVRKVSDGDSMPEPVNLPNISLVMDKKAEIKFSEPFKFQNLEQKSAAGTPDNGLQIPFKFKSSNTATATTPTKLAATINNKQEKRINGNDSDISKKFDISPSKYPISFPSQATTYGNRSVEHTVDSPIKPQPIQNCFKLTTTSFKFTEPIVLKAAPKSVESPTYNNFGRKFDYQFSEPTFVSADNTIESTKLKPEAAKSLTSNFKFDTKSADRIPSDSGICETTLGSNASKNSSVLAFKPATKDNGFSAGKTVSSSSTQLKDDDTFKSSIGATSSKTNISLTATKPVVDDVFKAIVSKQKSSWECSACMAQNDVSKSKCVCCAQPKDGGAPASTAPAATSAALATPKPVVDDVFKSIVNKQKSSWECSACMAQNDASKSKCVCCEQSRDVTAGATSGTTMPIKSQFSFGSNAANTTAPKSTFSFGSNPNAQATSVASGFSFGNLPAKTNPPAATTTTNNNQFVFGNLKSTEPISAAASVKKTDADDDKTKEKAVQKPTFSFGNPTVLPSTSSSSGTTVAAAAATAPVAPAVQPDDIFKSIAAKQKSESWECGDCMTKNQNSDEKCACCESPKPGCAPKTSEKKDFGLPLSSKFSFGTPSNTFSFGSKPAADSSKPGFQFGSLGSNAGTAGTSTAASTTITAPIPSIAGPDATKAANLFGGSSNKPEFAFSPPKPAIDSSAVKPAPASGFQFSFGSAAATATKPSVFGGKDISQDVTDTGPTPNLTSNKSVTVLENVLVKPATNGPNEATKPLFSFGQAPINSSSSSGIGSQSTVDQPSQAKKRPNTDPSDNNILVKAPATGSSAAFVFGQPQNVNNTSFSAIGSSPATNISTQQSSTAQQSTTQQQKPPPTFAFGTSKPSISTFPTVQPSFASSPFAFGASSPPSAAPVANAAAATAAAPLNTPSQPIFGSNVAFSSNPSALTSLGGFKTTFGSSAPAFGAAPSPNTEVSILFFEIKTFQVFFPLTYSCFVVFFLIQGSTTSNTTHVWIISIWCE